MSHRFEPPADDLARRILAKVPYENRLPAGRLTSRLGIMRGTVRGLPELHLYLTPDDRTLPAVSLDRLAGWIETVVADEALAREVRRATAAAPSYVEACQATYAIVGERLAQARHALGADGDEARSEDDR